jgi:hypothetical protein
VRAFSLIIVNILNEKKYRTIKNPANPTINNTIDFDLLVVKNFLKEIETE